MLCRSIIEKLIDSKCNEFFYALFILYHIRKCFSQYYFTNTAPYNIFAKI